MFTTKKSATQLAKITLYTLSLILIVLVIVLSQSAKKSAEQNQKTNLSQSQKQEVEAIIKTLVVNDSELFKQAIIAFQTREQQLEQTNRGGQLQQHQQALYQIKTDPFKGNANPEISMVYFTDFNCPYCKRIEPALTRLLQEYPQLKIIVKMVPLQGASSIEAVQLAQTVWLNEPEKFAALSKKLMASPRRLDSATIAKVAELTDTQMWLKKTDPRVDNIVQANLTLMRQLGIGGTPSMIFGSTIIPGLVPYEQLKQQLDVEIALLKKQKG